MQVFHRRPSGAGSVSLSLASLLLSAPCWAQAPAQEPPPQPGVALPPITVTTPVPKAAPKRAPAAPVAVQPLVQPTSPVLPAGTSVTALAPGLPAASAAQTVSTVDRERTENTRAFSVGDLLQEVPGISIKQGNGPRDFGVSIRGSNARNGFGVRNIQVFEDGFPVTQPDGLSRTDLTDPHAYGGVDVWRGPSSALFGNYALGGAINFRQRPGGDINGFEVGSDVGSFGYFNTYMLLGEKKGNFEYSLFASDVRGAGHLDYNAFNTQTVDLLATFTPSASDRFTFKFIHNEINTELSFRLSLNQFFQNPYQTGCNTFVSGLAAKAAGCGTGTFFNNGFNGVAGTSLLTAAQAGLGRNDQRTIAGARWDHKVDANSEWQVQLVVDDRNINQPTGTTSAIGDYLSYNASAGLIQRYSLLGLPARHLVGIYVNELPNNGNTYNVTSAGNAALGRLTQNVLGGTQNAGARIREEIMPDDAWTLVLGANLEKTHLFGISTNYAYTGAGPQVTSSIVSSDRDFMNHAQEAGLVFKPDAQWQMRGRVATAYGVPQLTNLFVNALGQAGDNTQLQPQSNIGYDIGLDWAPSKAFKLSVTGFYEFFQNEIVTQSAGVNTQSYAFNAPRSEHRGVEVAADWRFLAGWRATAAYLYNDQVYTDYSERPAGGPNLFNRAGNKIPGNSPNELLARFGYDQPNGAFKGLGAYVEMQWKDAFFMDNGNDLKAPGYELVNLNVHYTPEIAAREIKSLSMFFEVRNLLDRTYVASANNIANAQTAGGVESGANVLANSTGSIYAGTPRTFYGGVRVKF